MIDALQRKPRLLIDRMPCGPMLLLALTLALLAGCSAVRMGYDQLPTLSYWWLDSYFDFSDEQETQIKHDLREIHQWHRSTQLPAYADLLASVGDQSLVDGDPKAACRDIDRAVAQADALAAHLSPYLARWARQLKPAQLAHLRKEIDQANAEWREEWLDLSADKLAQKRYEQWLDRASRFYGDVSDEQKSFMKSAIARSAFDVRLSWEQRLLRQRDMVAALARIVDTRADEDAAQAEIDQLLDKTLHPPESDYHAMLGKLVAETCDNLARLHDLTTTSQRQRAREKLAGYERDLRILHRD